MSPTRRRRAAAPSVLVSALALGIALGVLPGASADPPEPGAPGAPSSPGPAAADPTERAQAALDQAADLLRGEPASTGPAGVPAAGDASAAMLALRELFLALPRLTGADRSQARALLARPTDGPGDAYGNGYSVPSVQRCEGNVCVHWVRRTADAPPSDSWATKTLRVMNTVWRQEVDRLGYRRPLRDGRRGGNGNLDVYLKDIGAQGLYGYCVPERRSRQYRRLAAGYCVLDNDFARSQFGAAPIDSLRVTAAHEFFHAVQFAYDFREDPWMMESTSTWMEERVFDGVNDNRQYLRYGQLRRPAVSLDRFEGSGLVQYGNWAWWEYLSQRFGNWLVRRAWDRAGAFAGAPNQYSVAALRSLLGPRGGLTGVFASYAAHNTMPGRTYPEGGAWPSAAISGSSRLSPSSPVAGTTTRINHLAARDYSLTPDSALSDPGWRLRITIDGPSRVSSPAAYLIVRQRSGDLVTRAVPLSRLGRGQVTVPFSGGSTTAATLTLANASTRYRCQRGGERYACSGVPLDQARKFSFSARVFR